MKKLSKTQLLVLLCIILISIITSIIIFYPKTSQDGIRLSKLSETSTSGNAYKIQIQGELAYTLNLDNAYFRTYNISNPNLPQLLDSLQLNETTHDMQIVGERAFVASRYAGLHIINIEDPMNLTKLGFFACESIEAIYIDNSIAYIGSHYEYLQILNISDDTNPVEINFPLVFENDIHGLGILDKYLLAAGSQGLFIFNITNSTNPILINQFSDIGAFSHFVLHGNYMFVPQWTQGLKVLNITNLNDIEEITASYATTTPVDI
ncbi:MAG: LVIVD repeat-containing protein, partial [Candidatus Hodarchaeota archaeon]